MRLRTPPALIRFDVRERIGYLAPQAEIMRTGLQPTPPLQGSRAHSPAVGKFLLIEKDGSVRNHSGAFRSASLCYCWVRAKALKMAPVFGIAAVRDMVGPQPICDIRSFTRARFHDARCACVTYPNLFVTSGPEVGQTHFTQLR